MNATILALWLLKWTPALKAIVPFSQSSHKIQIDGLEDFDLEEESFLRMKEAIPRAAFSVRWIDVGPVSI